MIARLETVREQRAAGDLANELIVYLRDSFVHIINPQFARMITNRYMKTLPQIVPVRKKEKELVGGGVLQSESLQSSLSRSLLTKCTDESIGLDGWVPFSTTGTGSASKHDGDSNPFFLHSQTTSLAASSEMGVKEMNKTKLKRLLLLSLRHIGMTRKHAEFMSTWKHMYCACIFALRKELGRVQVKHEELLAVIKNNMTFLNIK